jgi:SAM-dependent methyltransferase
MSSNHFSIALQKLFAKMSLLPKSSRRQLDSAIASLLKVYEQRPDLQEVYPEVRAGNYARLIDWAAGVSRQAWKDSSFPVLRKHAAWYSAQSIFVPKAAADPRAAFKTWDRPDETLEGVERRIHDGVSIDKLPARANGYVNALCSFFPWATPRAGAVILEIGSGVGYIMEAANRKFRPSRIIGLDVAPRMVEKAKERLARDGVDMPAEFLIYDGITIPMEAQSVDYVYSVACLQHIPKPYVYHLFGEMMRILKPAGFAALHFLAFSVLKLHKGSIDFPREIVRQLAGAEGHWHHFYSADELSYVLTHGYGAKRVQVVEAQGSIWASFAPGREH